LGALHVLSTEYSVLLFVQDGGPSSPELVRGFRRLGMPWAHLSVTCCSNGLYYFAAAPALPVTVCPPTSPSLLLVAQISLNILSQGFGIIHISNEAGALGSGLVCSRARPRGRRASQVLTKYSSMPRGQAGKGQRLLDFVVSIPLPCKTVRSFIGFEMMDERSHHIGYSSTTVHELDATISNLFGFLSLNAITKHRAKRKYPLFHHQPIVSNISAFRSNPFAPTGPLPPSFHHAQPIHPPSSSPK
jgi:hypothetical protein